MKQHASKAEAMLKALANTHRLMILCHLISQERTVSDLVDLIDLSHSATSQHLAKMRDLDMVIHEKRGQHVYYRVANPEIQAIMSTLYLIYCNK